MIYALVFIGSFLVIFVIVGGRTVLKNRSVRKFVRSVKQRVNSAEERGAQFVQESPADKPDTNSRSTAIQLQKVRTLINAAERAEARDKLEEAESCYIQALTAYPDAHEAHAQLAKLYLNMGRDQKAEAMYRELLTKIDDASCYSNLGLAYYRQGKFDRACASYQKALERDPQSHKRMAAFGRALFASERFGEAMLHLERATARISRDTELLRLLAESCEKSGDNEKAFEVYKKINKLEPYDEEVKNKIANATQ
ncbi:MAG: tetratricopeptide repeat protein [Candidatus Peribacteraceae bacterium]|nr:tetratricopeptide repeat protein [Candidatus Peribacteraceae bacterium]HCI04260.1 hypothetical protein [Candidatus Peribacteria bacterium]